MNTLLRLLLIEDSSEDAFLLTREISKGGFDIKCLRVCDAEAMRMALGNSTWDVVIADYALPEFSGMEALAVLKESRSDVPFIIVSGAIGEDVAVAAMKAGVHDFVQKDRLFRLVPAIRRELHEAVGREACAQAERRLHVTLEKLVESNRQLDEFAYIVSHDLKEPLRGIHNYAEFLLEDYGAQLDEAGQDKLHTLKRLTRRMEVLIESLLQFSRMSRSEVGIKQTDIGVVVGEVLDSLQVLISERNAKVMILQRLPSINCDGPLVAEVYRNLITNAIKYNKRDEVTVEIGCGKLNLPANRPLVAQSTVFYVRDNGIGIPEKNFDSVFRMFKRLHGHDQFGGGSGLGLAIVKNIVERHNGVIWIESEIGVGTTFYFTLKGVTDATISAECSLAADSSHR